MSILGAKLRRSAWMGLALVVLACLVSGTIYFSRSNFTTAASHRDQSQDASASQVTIAVKATTPKEGLMGRYSTQPGSIVAYESVRLFAKVPGFLKSQKVDLGAKVKANDVLAVVDVPELETQLRRNEAALDQACARVTQMKARLDSAVADRDATRAAVPQAEANAKSAAAWVRYRSKQLQRMKDLVLSKSIEEALYDEHKERFDASVETELSAREAITTTRARVVASEAKIEQAKADIIEAESEVRVAEADIAKVRVQLDFATIRAPFDGVVAQRSLDPGGFVRSANEGSNLEPLLTIQRTDKFRMIVQVPDRDVPFADPGDPAEVEIDALPGVKIDAKISRIASTEDSQTRLMRVEIDLPNYKGLIRQGMYGRVTILLDKGGDLLSVPSACLVGKAEKGVGAVYVVRSKQGIQQAFLQPLRVGADNGVRVAVLNGLTRDDAVIVQPGASLSNGTPVTVSSADEAPPIDTEP